MEAPFAMVLTVADTKLGGRENPCLSAPPPFPTSQTKGTSLNNRNPWKRSIRKCDKEGEGGSLPLIASGGVQEGNDSVLPKGQASEDLIMFR